MCASKNSLILAKIEEADGERHSHSKMAIRLSAGSKSEATLEKVGTERNETKPPTPSLTVALRVTSSVRQLSLCRSRRCYALSLEVFFPLFFSS